MSTRKHIIARVREALREPTADGVRHGEANPRPTPAAERGREKARDFLPPVPKSHEDRRALFARWSQDLKTEFHAVADRDAAMAKLVELRDACGWTKVASHHHALNHAASEVLALPVLWTDGGGGGYDKRDLAACDVGITGCDALIAQTGSVLITARSAGGRALSVLPPHHVVIATADQLLPDLIAGYDRLGETHGHTYPSFMSLITGPSRTGDIERTLVLGAHGPKRLTVVMIEG